MLRAKTLEEAERYLDPRPLDFSGATTQGASIASNPAFYATPPTQDDGKVKLPGPIEKIRRRVLSGTPQTKLFLSGHVGSGKSTELGRLAVERAILNKFSVVMLRFEEQEWATLDTAQIRFRIAGALYEKHKDKLRHEARWKKLFADLNNRIFQPMGIQATDGSLGLEFNLVFVKLRQELKLSEKARKQFRAFGETQQSLLQDFLGALIDDVEGVLAKENPPLQTLVLVDDLDKVRGADEQKEIFDTNLSTLLALPLRIVYTLPTGVAFGENRADVRANVDHLYPIRVLRKAPETYNPEDAYIDERIGFFHTLIDHRVEPGLIEAEAIKLAAIHSGGVLRDFFRLLRDGIQLATYNDLSVLDAMILRYALKEARLKESMGLYGPDYLTLLNVHKTNDLSLATDSRFLDLSRVIESFNGQRWFDANPLLWPLLEEHSKKNAPTP
jgi:hypothetical protein